MTKSVVLVYVNHTRRALSAADARNLCADPVQAGRVIDALTDDAGLQDELRRLIDGDDDPLES